MLGLAPARAASAAAGRWCRHRAGTRRAASTLPHEPIAPHFGARVPRAAFDLATCSAAELRRLSALVYARGLVVLEGQERCAPEDELRLARAFNHTQDDASTSYTGGAAPQHKLPPPLQDVAVIGRFDLAGYHGLSARSEGVYTGWRGEQRAWHCDGLADTWPPPDITLMRCVATPARGGDTLFACARAAAARVADALLPSDPDPELVRMQYRLASEYEVQPHGLSLSWARGTKAEHTSDVNAAHAGTEVPLVIREAESSARALVSTYHAHGAVVMAADGSGRVASTLGFDEANAFLARAWAPGVADGLVHAHAWRVGEIAIWSNRLVLHSATALPPGPEARVHHRVRLRAAPTHAPRAWRAAAHASREGWLQPAAAPGGSAAPVTQRSGAASAAWARVSWE